MRTNFTNTGKAFEKEIEGVLVQYQAKNLLRMKKVDPPLRYIGGRVLHLANPFLDFIGSWTERGGRMVVMECKSTRPKTGAQLPFMEVLAEARLPLGDGGLTDRQRDSLGRWHDAGAAAFVLWRHGNRETALIPWPVIWTVDRRMDRRHLLWGDGVPVQAGTGFVTVDFLAAMRRVFHGETHIS